MSWQALLRDRTGTPLLVRPAWWRGEADDPSHARRAAAYRTHCQACQAGQGHRGVVEVWHQHRRSLGILGNIGVLFSGILDILGVLGYGSTIFGISGGGDRLAGPRTTIASTATFPMWW